MDKQKLFVLGGVLVVLSLMLKDWAMYGAAASPLVGVQAFIIPTLLFFLIVLLVGLSLMAKALFEK